MRFLRMFFGVGLAPTNTSRSYDSGQATFAKEHSLHNASIFHLNKAAVDISSSALHHLGDEDTGSALLTHNARQMIKKSTLPFSTHKKNGIFRRV